MVATPIEVTARRGQPLGMPPARFLRDYWQKRPLLIRGAFPGYTPPLGPDDLAGLACEELALSRLVLRDRRRERWTLRNGPFDEAAFAALPPGDWTLLVQDVDKWDADVAALLQQFRFLPSWRVDDVMVSYAVDGGGVGAHVDQYDVFLLQGLGRRRWSISTDPRAPREFRDNVELKQLRAFTPTHAWLLEPGDMLYLPPDVPHEGVAVGPCMTLSVGMRAPSRAELLLDAAEHLAERMPEALRYADPDLAPARAGGEIDAAALARAAAALGPLAQAFDRATLADWFGRFITRYRAAQFAAARPRPLTMVQFEGTLAAGTRLLRHPWSRFAWTRRGRAATLYVAGEALPCPSALAQRLCEPAPIAADDAALRGAAARTVALDLVNAGHLGLQRARRRAAR
ncbi:MAG TPA: cupin domain-containing protein [Mizugakiibacter sp.]